MLLTLETPKKARPTAEHNAKYSSDSGVAGTFVPNMSKADMLAWKGKKIGGKHPRVEIRKMVHGTDPLAAERMANEGFRYGGEGANVLLIVYADRLVMSANSRMVFDDKTFAELSQVVTEARQLLAEG